MPRATIVYKEITDMVTTQIQESKGVLRGQVPPGLFSPVVAGNRQANHLSRNDLAASTLLVKQTVAALGMSKTRLAVVLGYSVTDTWRLGHTANLSQIKMQRLAWLLLMKMAGIDTSVIYSVNWQDGIVYTNERGSG